MDEFFCKWEDFFAKNQADIICYMDLRKKSKYLKLLNYFSNHKAYISKLFPNEEDFSIFLQLANTLLEYEEENGTEGDYLNHLILARMDGLKFKPMKTIFAFDENSLKKDDYKEYCDYFRPISKVIKKGLMK